MAARCRSARPGRARIVGPAGHDLAGLPVLDRLASSAAVRQRGLRRARSIRQAASAPPRSRNFGPDANDRSAATRS